MTRTIPNAAVEAAARARTPYVFMDLRSPFRAHGESRSDAELREAERARECAKMRDALTAALPFLAAAPSATREDDLLTEPHDGHEASVTCPGCPHDTPRTDR